MTTPLISFQPNQALRSQDLNEIQPLAVVLPLFASQKTNSITLVGSGLVLPVAAGASYALSCQVFYGDDGTSTTPNISLQWSLPAGAVVSCVNLYRNFTTGQTTQTTTSTNPVIVAGSPGAAGPVWVAEMHGTLTAGAGGQIQLMFCQNTSSTSVLSIFSGSCLTLQRVS